MDDCNAAILHLVFIQIAPDFLKNIYRKVPKK